MPKFSKGFTIIELLVVVAIISVLTSIALASTTVYINKSKDARRQADLATMQKAITGYFIENGSYPSTGGAWWGECSDYGSHPLSGPTGYIPNLAPNFIGQLPIDPNGHNAGGPLCAWPEGGCYLYNSDGVGYKLLAHCTPTNFPAGGPFFDPQRTTWSYMLCSQSQPYCSW